MKKLVACLLCFTVVAVVVIQLHAVPKEEFYNIAQSWKLSSCDIPGAKEITVADAPELPVPNCNDCSPAAEGRSLSKSVELGKSYSIGDDTHPRYLDRAFATCDPKHQALAGFRVNTQDAGTSVGSIQGIALCSRHLDRQTRNTKTYYTPYANANDGAVGHEANCSGKAVVGLGFETHPEDDDMIRMRYDCAYDVELDASKPNRAYKSQWHGTGQTIDAYDRHGASCPGSTDVITRLSYVRCPESQEVSVVYDCASTTTNPAIVIDDEYHTADPVASPRAILTTDVSGDMQFTEEIRGVFSPIGQNVKEAAEHIGDIAENSVKGVAKVGRGFGSMFQGVADGVIGAGNRAGTKVVTAGNRFVKEDVGKIGKAFTSFPDAVKKKADTSFDRNLKPSLDSVSDLGPKIQSSAKSMAAKFTKTISGVINGIPAAFDQFGNKSKTCWAGVDRAWKV